MSRPQINNWQAVHDEVLRRIHARDWPPGAAIPNEADLAAEFGCARATVNRALQALADAGILDRRRRAGTRVALHPVRKATLSIPIIRGEVEGSGAAYGYQLLTSDHATPPAAIAARLGTKGRALLHLVSLHSADGRPHVLEDRWINDAAVPGIHDADFAQQNANEWLVANAPFTSGDIVFGASAATAAEAAALACATGDAVFTVERTTWNGAVPITWVRLAYAPGYRMRTEL